MIAPHRLEELSSREQRSKAILPSGDTPYLIGVTFGESEAQIGML